MTEDEAVVASVRVIADEPVFVTVSAVALQVVSQKQVSVARRTAVVAFATECEVRMSMHAAGTRPDSSLQRT